MHSAFRGAAVESKNYRVSLGERRESRLPRNLGASLRSQQRYNNSPSGLPRFGKGDLFFFFLLSFLFFFFFVGKKGDKVPFEERGLTRRTPLPRFSYSRISISSAPHVPFSLDEQ